MIFGSARQQVRQCTRSNCSGLQGDLHYHITAVLKLFPHFSIAIYAWLL